MEFENFPTHETVPSYAILSHTWGNQEVTFQEMTNYNNRTVVDETTIRPREIVPPGQQLEQSEKQNSNEQNFKNAHDQIRERHSFLHRFRNRKEENIHFNHETPKNGKKPITHEILLQADIDTGVNITQGISQANNSIEQKKGFLKILGTAEIALEQGIQYVWVDTCCIDKTSSAELSEAINSMFQWYQNATVCFAFLGDVEIRQRNVLLEEALKSSRWFTRGWTLQELIAPNSVEFFAADWNSIGSKQSLRKIISSITGINVDVLEKPQLLRTMSVARRMSWAAHRNTTRIEDVAYCLLGIFGVNMPLLYGEGPNAFIRLQEELVKESEDQSLFAWQYDPRYSNDDLEGKRMAENEGIFAIHPIAFKDSSRIVSYGTERKPYNITSRGLQIELPITGTSSIGLDVTALLNKPYGTFTGVLACHYEHNLSGSIGISLSQVSDRCYRDADSKLIFVKNEETSRDAVSTLYIHKSGKRPPKGSYPSYLHIGQHPNELHFIDGIASPASVSTEPSESFTPWDLDTLTIALPSSFNRHYAALRFEILSDPRNKSSEMRDMTTIIISLDSRTSGTFAMLSVSQSAGPLLELLQTHNTETKFVRGSFPVSNGHLIVTLDKTRLFDQDTFTIDIAWAAKYKGDKSSLQFELPGITITEL